MKSPDPVFRKTFFGGFNREDVIGYITKLKNEFYDYKKNSEQIINNLNQKITSLNVLLEKAASVSKEDEDVQESPVSDNEIVSLSIHEITKAAADLKSVAELICGNFDSFFEKFDSKIQIQASNIEEASKEIDSDKTSTPSFFDDILLNIESKTEKADLAQTPPHVSQFNDLLNF